MSSWRVFNVTLKDEIPRVGSGERLVEAEVGTKWVRVRKHTRYAETAHTSRLRRASWDALNPQEVPDEP